MVDVRVYPGTGDELPPGANMVVRVYVAQKRKIGQTKWQEGTE